MPAYRKLLLTLPDIAELEAKPTAAEPFDCLLANPLELSITAGRERLLIAINALDEAGGNGRKALVKALVRHAPRLPDWLGASTVRNSDNETQI